MAQTPFGQVIRLTDTGPTRTNTPEYEKMVTKPKNEQRVGESVFTYISVSEEQMMADLATMLSEHEMDTVQQVTHYYKHGVQLGDSDLSLVVNYGDPTQIGGGGPDPIDPIRADDDFPAPKAVIFGLRLSF